MKFTTLHTIITGLLAQRKYPIHFYADFLIYAQRGLEELHFDTLKNVQAVKIPVNDFGEAPLPDNYLDIVSLGVVNGQFVRPLISRPGINSLANFDASTPPLQVTYPDAEYYAWGSLGYTIRYNNFQEFTGGVYGYRPDRTDTFKVIKDRNVIQVHQYLCATDVILEFISDGSEISNATQVDPYAKSTIEAFIVWKYKENNRSYSQYDCARAQKEFDHQHGILRARKNDLTIADIKYIRQKNTGIR